MLQKHDLATWYQTKIAKIAKRKRFVMQVIIDTEEYKNRHYIYVHLLEAQT